MNVQSEDINQRGLSSIISISAGIRHRDACKYDYEAYGAMVV